MGKRITVTIDGPAGSGKSTAARTLAERLGYRYLDTGATYRALALKAVQSRLSPDDVCGLKRILSVTRIEVGSDGRILLDGRDVTEEIRAPEVGMMASLISRRPEVREVLWELQRRIGRGGGVVAEGRDTGSVVFPEAEVKFYLDATLEERARRRYRELLAKGRDVSFREVLDEVRKRDLQDSTREIAPLRIPEGAIYIDSTHLSPEEVVELMLHKIEERI